jgi:putative DNA primase/helicase
MAETVAEEVLAGRLLWVIGLDWMSWDGHRWVETTEVVVVQAIRRYSKEQFAAAAAGLATGESDEMTVDGWRTMLGANKESAVLRLSKGLVTRRADEMDADPNLLNTPGAVVDLRDGTVQAPSPDLLMTKITRGAYRPGFRHVDWDTALQALDETERVWFQGRIGQGITGHPPQDDRLIVLQGSGENGKSALTTGGPVPALGDYASVASTKLIQATKTGSEHSTEVADLRGRRLVIMEELTEARAIDVTSLKRLQVRAGSGLGTSTETTWSSTPVTPC